MNTKKRRNQFYVRFSFDSIYVLQYLIENGYEPKFTLKGNRVQLLTHGSVISKDFYSLCPTSLASMTQSFDLSFIPEKMYFPHLYVTLDGLYEEKRWVRRLRKLKNKNRTIFYFRAFLRSKRITTICNRKARRRLKSSKYAPSPRIRPRHLFFF